jgi:hypothetical protein
MAQDQERRLVLSGPFDVLDDLEQHQLLRRSPAPNADATCFGPVRLPLDGARRSMSSPAARLPLGLRAARTLDLSR